jgi:hypothetical protein
MIKKRELRSSAIRGLSLWLDRPTNLHMGGRARVAEAICVLVNTCA